jgi:putative transposase
LLQLPIAGLEDTRGGARPDLQYRKAIQSPGFQASMSRKADCYDNAPMKSFFHTLKTELVHHRHSATRADATRRGWQEVAYRPSRYQFCGAG